MKELQNKGEKNKKNAEMTNNVLGDDRFTAMFEDTEYAIDRNSEAYRMFKPTEGRRDAGDSDDET